MNQGQSGAMELEAPRRGSQPPIKAGFIVGPTGTGKTALAIEVAQRLGAEIVNADSRQLYRGMDIGTAKPGKADLVRVRHHLIDVCSPGQPLDVAQFRELARGAIADIAARGRPVLIVGGSGLYLRVLRYGIFSGPPAEPRLRRELLEAATQHGVEYLYEQLRTIDPASARRLEPRDLYRIVRAIEIFRLTGIPISRHQASHGFSQPEYSSLTIGLRTARQRLYGAIDQRLDAMVAAGLVAEVQGLLDAGYAPDKPPLSTIGYKHVAAHLRGEIGLEGAVQLAKRDTRRMAKRQMTWFRREPDIIWIDAESAAEQAYTRLAGFFSTVEKARSNG